MAEIVKLDNDEYETFKDLLDSGVEQAGKSLGEMTGKTVNIRIPSVEYLSAGTIAEKVIDHVGVKVTFFGNLTGMSILLFTKDNGRKFTNLLIGEEGYDEAAFKDALGETGNIVLRGILGAISNLLKEKLVFGFPQFLDVGIEKEIGNSDDPHALELIPSTIFRIENTDITGEILLVFNAEDVNKLKQALKRMAE